jgi:Zn-dependent alcohol dehydrogenase
VEGGYGINPTFPAIGGNEGVAVVTEVGTGVSSLSIGDFVIPSRAAFGTY